MKITRRGFLKAAGGAGLAVAAGTLRWPHRVAAGPSTTLRLLGHSAFNEDSDKAIAKIGNDFAAQHSAAFAGDFIDQPEVAAKLTAEEQARSGHDIIDLQDNLPTIHKDYLVPLDDVVAAKAKLTLDSPQTRAALSYVRKLFSQMDATVLSWDDSGNNKHMLSGRGSYTINAPSIYLRAHREKMPFAPSVRHTLAPSGPKGRFFYADIHGWGVFKFSPNIDLAKQFLRSMFTEASQKTALTLGSGYDMPVLPHFDQNPPYAKDSNLRLLVGFMRSAHLVAYPAPPSALAEKAYQTYVIPNMFAKAVQGASDGDAIASATTALVDIGYTR